MSEDWRQAIEHLYAVFACYRRPSMMDASPTRDAVAMMRDLTSAPLRELSPEALGAYAGSALTTVGSEGDYRHFLPRIIELSITSHGWMGLDPEVIAGRLIYGHWRQWADDAQTAILRAFAAAWIETRRMDVDLADGTCPLCALAILGQDIAPLLAVWALPTSATEVRQMVRHIQAAADLKREVYWKQAGAANRCALWDWARSQPVREGLEACAVHFVADDDLWEIDRVLIDISIATEPEGRV